MNNVIFNKKSIFFIFLFLPIFLYSQTLSIEKGWNLLGATSDIKDLSTFETECVNQVFVYERGLSDKWLVYPDDEKISIKRARGFWVHSKKACVIETDPRNNPQVNLPIKNIEVNETSIREYKIYVPENLSNDASLVFYHHGTVKTQNENVGFRDGLLSGLNKNHIFSKMADAENIVVVYPLALKLKIGREPKPYVSLWAKANLAYELEFFDKMVEHLLKTYPKISNKKIYVNGHSSGGIYSFALAGLRSNIIAAAAPVAGRYTVAPKGGGEYPEFTKDGISIPLIAFSGENDGLTKGMEKNMDDWHKAENEGSLENATKEDVKVGRYDGIKKTYKGGLSDLEFYKLKDVGHQTSWEALFPTMWEFFKSHTRK